MDEAKQSELTSALVAAYRTEGTTLRKLAGRELPSFEEVARISESLRELLIPEMAIPKPLDLERFAADRLADLAPRLHRQVLLGLGFDCAPNESPCRKKAWRVVEDFLGGLPSLRSKLDLDAAASYDADPAASGADEVVFCYPGLFAITVHRLAHQLAAAGAPVIPRMMAEFAHSRTGIDIHPGAHVGDRFFIDHGTGVVIGETADIGSRVRIYQGVTLGALSVPKETARSLQGKKRHPTIEDDVIIYANATILGGATVIGHGAIIGGNCWITESVPPGTRVTRS